MKRSKHIDIRYYYIREKSIKGAIKLLYYSTKDQAVDGITKPLRANNFSRFIDLIGLDKAAVKKLHVG